MTLLARDETDIVGAQIAFHLHAGVDFVIATDNGSVDGTTAILESYARDGVLHLIHEPGRDMRPEECVTRMARLAASDFDADWVLNSDADEFWWPRGGTLPEVLATIPPRYGVVRCLWRHFVPRSSADPFFAERMTVRLSLDHPWNDQATPFRVNHKVVHRADRDVLVTWGNHDVQAPGLVPLRGWFPIEVLHFPLRTPEQLVAAYDACSEGRLREGYDSFVVDDAALERGIRDGTLAVDTRLRDMLRTLRVGDPKPLRIGPPEADRVEPAFPIPDLADEASCAADASVLAEQDGTRQLERRLDALEARTAALRPGLWSRVRRARRGR